MGGRHHCSRRPHLHVSYERPAMRRAEGHHTDRGRGPQGERAVDSVRQTGVVRNCPDH